MNISGYVIYFYIFLLFLLLINVRSGIVWCVCVIINIVFLFINLKYIFFLFVLYIIWENVLFVVNWRYCIENNVFIVENIIFGIYWV